MRQKVAIYGGAFDPIHNGHSRVAEAVQNRGYQVWMLPSFFHPFGKQMEAHEDRMQMCGKAVAPLPNVIVLGHEKDNATGFTFKLLGMLREKYPDIDFSLVLGEQDALEIADWTHGPELIASTPFLVVPTHKNISPGSDVWYKTLPHQYLDDVRTPNVSSTMIRKALAEGQTHPELNRSVMQVIEQKGLYKFPKVKLS